MYVSARGLGATSRLTRFQAGVLARAKRARGLRGFGALNCPGDPGCPGYVAPAGDQAAIDAALALAASGACTCQPDGTCLETGNSCVPRGTPITQGIVIGQTFTQWLNANSKTVAIAAAAGFGLLLLSGGRGRR